MTKLSVFFKEATAGKTACLFRWKVSPAVLFASERNLHQSIAVRGLHVSAFGSATIGRNARPKNSRKSDPGGRYRLTVFVLFRLILLLKKWSDWFGLNKFLTDNLNSYRLICLQLKFGEKWASCSLIKLYVCPVWRRRSLENISSRTLNRVELHSKDDW